MEVAISWKWQYHLSKLQNRKMEKITIGIEKRISLGVLEMALRAVLDENATSEYFLELNIS